MPEPITMPQEIELVSIADLAPYAANARTHSAEQIDQLAAAIEQWGWTNPVLINGSNGIIAGHGRILAAAQLGLDEVPCIRLAHLSAVQERALIIADNRIALNSGWNDELLAAELRALAEAEFDMPLIGFDPAALDKLLADVDEADGTGRGNLADEFLIAPFSVLNAREGWWQDRKRAWLALGITSEVGRGENLLKMSDTMLEPDPVKRAAMQGKAKTFHDGAELRAGKGGLADQVAAAATQRAGRKRQGTVLGPELGGNAGSGQLGKYHGKGLAWTFGQDLMRGEHVIGSSSKIELGAVPSEMPAQYTGQGGDLPAASGTSIFDPVLCELAYLWFSPRKGRVLDPFAGGSVRGIVAARLGRRYRGIDLRPEQVEANRAQWESIGGDGDGECEWIIGDSREVLSEADTEFDFVFSCPPYGDLEVYSDDPADLSTMEAADFALGYEAVIRRSIAALKPDRFACFVVGDYRDPKGLYRDFVSQTIAAFRAAGAALYNEAILVTAAGSLPIRAGKQFRATRKLGKTHQQVLVFVKGDPIKAAKACGTVDVSAALEMFEAANPPPASEE